MIIPKRNISRILDKVIHQPGYALKVFLQRTNSYLTYKFANGKSSYPESITFFLTHRCNLHCKMCGQWGETGVSKSLYKDTIKEELSYEKLTSIVDNVVRFKPSITLFGGEPLLHKSCLDLIRYIKNKKLHCLMITNGALLEKVAENIVENGLDELNLSIDGDEKLHDDIRGMPGLFNRIKKGIDTINYWKEKKKATKPLINLQCTITSYNYQHLEQLLKVAEEFKTNSLTYHHLIFIDQQTYDEHNLLFHQLFQCSSKDWAGFISDIVKDIDFKILTDKLTKIKSQKTSFFVNIYPNFTDNELSEYYQIKKIIPQGYHLRCLSPWIVSYIFPNGDVRPCLNFDYVFGNLNEKKFIEIWNSAKSIKFRNELKRIGYFPVCTRCTEFYRY